MSKSVKYIRIKGVSGIVLFPPSLIHADVARGHDVESAGFVDLKNMECFGQSISLELSSDPLDTKILRHMFGGDTHQIGAEA